MCPIVDKVASKVYVGWICRRWCYTQKHWMTQQRDEGLKRTDLCAASEGGWWPRPCHLLYFEELSRLHTAWFITNFLWLPELFSLGNVRQRNRQVDCNKWGKKLYFCEMSNAPRIRGWPRDSKLGWERAYDIKYYINLFLSWTYIMWQTFPKCSEMQLVL